MSAPAFSNSTDLLRRLEPAVRPGALAAAATAQAGPSAAGPGLFDALPFEQLLALAFDGTIRSERPIQVGAACDLRPPVDAGQLERLALAADQAQAGGATRALMMVDGRGLVVDIATRSIVAEMKPGQRSDVMRVDAAMVVPALSGNQANGPPFAGLNTMNAARFAMHAPAAPRGFAPPPLAPNPR